MVIKNLTIIFFLLSFLFTQAQSRAVESIEIKELDSHDETRRAEYQYEKIACEKFKPTKEQIINYFKISEEASGSGDWLHEYYSPCISRGKVTFKDGSSGNWNIQSSGLGFVIFNNGKTANFFYKNNKWTDPYACSYGLGDDPEPGC